MKKPQTEKSTKSYSIDEALDQRIGKKGTLERDLFDLELNLEVVSHMIKKARKEQHLTQEQLGELIGVQKYQISRLENQPGNVTMSTILKVFNALKQRIKVKFEPFEEEVTLA